jgi:hypothetical protein
MKPLTCLASLLRAASVAAVCVSLGCAGPKSAPAPRVAAPAAPTPIPESVAPDAAALEGVDGAEEAPKPPPFTPFGLPECDTFLNKYLACVDRIPADQRGRFEDELRENRTRWWKLADMQQGMVAVGLACRIFAQSKKADLAVDYGCEF